MSEISGLRARLEADWTWRIEELLLLANVIRTVEHERDRERLRRSAILMLYAHFEGFIKQGALAYIEYVNRVKISLKDANPYLAACALADDFREFQMGARKSQIFKNEAPDDETLHALYRNVELMRNIEAVLMSTLSIEHRHSQQVANTESNLRPVVMRKILYRLGFEPSLMKHEEDTIGKLLGRRNSIGHGSDRNTVHEEEYDRLFEAVQQASQRFMAHITRAARERWYLRQPDQTDTEAERGAS